MKTVFERVKHVIADVVSVNEKSIIPDASLLEDLGADSLDIINLTFALEEEFSDIAADVNFDEEAMKQIQTVRQLLDFLAQAGIVDR